MIRISPKTILRYSLYALGGIFMLATLVGIVATGIDAGTFGSFLSATTLILFAFFYEKLHRLLRIGMLALITVGILFASFLPIYGSIDTVDYQEDAVIVLGAGLRGEEPSKALRFRLDTAYEYAMKNPTAIIVVSGGQGKNELVAESTAMKRYLVKKGVAEERIIEEDQSTSTKENMIFSKAILDEKLGTSYRTAIITNDFHVLRAETMADSVGFASVTHISGRTPISVFVPCTLRECVAVIYHAIF